MAFPGGFGGGFSGYGGYPGMGGQYPGMGMPGGMMGQREPDLNPTLKCYGLTGLPIALTIDTGAQLTMISRRAFMKHFQGHCLVDTQKSISIGGIGGQSQQSLGRFTMALTVPAPDGQQLRVSGECWIAPMDFVAEVLLGMPFLKLNRMHLTWNENGMDYVDIQGQRVPIDMKNGNF